MDEKTTGYIAVLIGVSCLILGADYYFGFMGFWDYLGDLIPWYPDEGNLEVTCWDGLGDNDTLNDIKALNATVQILGTEFIDTTDEANNGTVTFTGVEVGDYTVVAEYKSEQINKTVTIEKDATATLEFRFNSTT